MEQTNRLYAAIDLKSFYASVECIERQLNPLTTNLVVADAGRTNKTICLAVSPALKAHGVSGRPRLFEVVRKVAEINNRRRMAAPNHILTGESMDAAILEKNPALSLGYITAVPRMALYLDYSTRVYSVYLNYVSPEDIHIYSIDEVFIDLTPYISLYKISAHELTRRLISAVLAATGITATAGIGPNLYLAKIAMDIVAKKIPPDADGVRIAALDEKTYRQTLWAHRPLTSFWRLGKGYAKKLEANGLYTMGDIARCSLGKPTDYYNEDFLYKLFGVNAELLIDHAWGYEPCGIAEIKAYRPQSKSLSSGQVLSCPYPYDKAKIIVREMADGMAYELLKKNLTTDQIVLTIGYDAKNLAGQTGMEEYKGEIKIDRYGRKTPKHAHGTANLPCRTASSRLITEETMRLFQRITDSRLLVRRITLAVCRVKNFAAARETEPEEISLFTAAPEDMAAEKALAREENMQRAVLSLQEKFGKNAVIKAASLLEGATARDRNSRIGGHKA